MFDVFYIGPKPNLFVHEKSVASIAEAQQLSRTRFFWIVNYLCDYTGFDFLWEPVCWQQHQRHAWASQWQQDAETYLVPKQGYTETNYHRDQTITRLAGSENWNVPAGVDVGTFDFTWHPDPADPPYIYQFGTQHQRTGGPKYIVPGATDIKFVDQIRIRATDMGAHIYGINHMDGNELPECVKTTRYVDNYLDTLRRIASNVPAEHEFIWIVSSVCDYTDFDFSWHPEQWQATMLHVFASDNEKFGDTFFMHVPTFKERSRNCELLDWYDLNFVEGISVPRHALPVIQHSNDTHVEAIKTAEWSGPLAVLTVDGNVPNIPCVPLWREKTKTIVPLSAGASSVVIPKCAVPYIKKQLYDYPYIDKTHATGTDAPLDIVFISNGESCAVHNLWVLNSCLGDCPKNRVHVVENVNGRAAAYHAAARASTTPWFFAVFAKLEVDWYFPWEWQPDRMQEPKHYIFHAHNEVNRLEYGHQAMIAYNRELVLNNPGIGLDFTLDSAHEVVPILSGIARYCSSPWMAWRTAFREVLKLRASLPDVESEYRIKQWLTPRDPAHTVIVNQEWSHIGAEDAMDYYDAVNGDFDALKKSYEWEWLTTYALLKRNLLPE